MIEFDIKRQDWEAVAPRSVRSFGPFTHVEGHHSVTPEVWGADDAKRVVRQFQRDHLNRGWWDVFYHGLIASDGLLVEGRHGGSGALKLCFIGSFEDGGGPTSAALATFARVAGDVGGLDKIDWHSHRAKVEGKHFSACPGRGAIAELEKLKSGEADKAAPEEETEMDGWIEESTFRSDIVSSYQLSHRHRAPTRKELAEWVELFETDDRSGEELAKACDWLLMKEGGEL